MDLARIAKTDWGSTAALTMAGLLPRRTAYAIGDAVFDHLSTQGDAPLVRNTRGNLAVLHGLPEHHPALDIALRRLFRQTCRSYVDLSRAAARGASVVASCCRIDPSLYRLLEQAAIEERGLVLTGLHTCAFDFALVTLGRWCLDGLVLGQAQPTGSAVVMNQLRRRLGLHVAPVTPAALREALTVLHRGGMVVVAADVPVPEGEELVFLGRTARLPTGHARLALAADVDFLVCYCHRLGAGRYRIMGDRVPRPRVVSNRRRLAAVWAQDALARLEAYVRRWPDEWLMPQPLWAAPCT